jgi:glyoxylase-like metal-dependent hydrolase (beta-lactamase superfamily II)
MAIVVPLAEVLVCGDYLSPVEIPMVSPGGSLDAYVGTLERLRPLVERAQTVVPGHGAPVDRERALAILGEDRAYLEALGDRGREAALPSGRDTPFQRRVHADNAGALDGG